MWVLGAEQHYICPEEFQDRINQAGGVNRYDLPNFKIVWGGGGEPESLFRAGGEWHNETAPFTGYRDLRLVNEPAWVLLMWVPPEIEGTPESYYVSNYDADTGLQTLGEYPYRGKYEIVSVLHYTEIINGQLRVVPLPLNSLLVDLIVPTLLDAKDMSLVKRKAVYAAMKQEEDARMSFSIGNSLEKGRLAFGSSPISYAGQLAKTMAVEEKAHRLKNNLYSAMKMAHRLNKGVFTE